MARRASPQRSSYQDVLVAKSSEDIHVIAGRTFGSLEKMGSKTDLSFSINGLAHQSKQREHSSWPARSAGRV